jgi:hypothetical protein
MKGRALPLSLNLSPQAANTHHLGTIALIEQESLYRLISQPSLGLLRFGGARMALLDIEACLTLDASGLSGEYNEMILSANCVLYSA